AGIVFGNEPYEVVGIVGDLQNGTRASPDLFLPLAQAPTYWIDLVVRTGGDPQALQDQVRRALRGLNRELLIENGSSLDAMISGAAALERAQRRMGGRGARVAGV